MKQFSKVAIAVLLTSLTWSATAKETPHSGKIIPDVQVRISYWVSEADNAENTYSDDEFSGTPLSRLEYNSLEADIFEFGAKFQLPKNFYFDLSYGKGDVDSGELIDDDYGSGLVRDFIEGPRSNGTDILLSRTSSDISKDDAEVLNIELGKLVLASANNRQRLSAFIKYQNLEETYSTNGLIQLECALPFEFCAPAGFDYDRVVDTEPGITNEVEWDSWLVGLAGEIDLTEKWSLRAKLGYVVDSEATAADTHHLREDLRHDPSFYAKTDADGFDLELELGYQFNNGIEMALGYRVIDRDYDRDDTAGTVFPVIDDGESTVFGASGDYKRDGAVLTVKYNFK